MVRLVRFLPAALAAYESRYLVAHLGSFGTLTQAAGSRLLTLFGLALVAVLAGVFLREGARGIAAPVPQTELVAALR